MENRHIDSEDLEFLKQTHSQKDIDWGCYREREREREERVLEPSHLRNKAPFNKNFKATNSH